MTTTEGNKKEKNQNVCFCCFNKMRISRKKLVFVLFIIIVMKVIWVILSKQNEKKFTQTCNQSGKYQEDLHAFADGVHSVLEVLNLTHFLCYGSLWGQIRLSRLLPWEDKAVMCLLNEELSSKDELMVVRMFKKKGYQISYSATRGEFTVEMEEEKKMKVMLILFEMDSVVKLYRRIGWFRRILPPACEVFDFLDCFPPRLLISPLQKKEFGKSWIPVPREGIEIQKYHYKNDWWKEIALKNC